MTTGPIILSTGSLYNFDVDSAMAFAREAGFDGLELVIDWRTETYRRKRLETLVARHGLPILALHSPFPSMRLQGWPRDPVARITRAVELAEALGAQTVVVHPPGRWIRLQGAVTTPDRTRRVSLPLPLLGPGRLGRWLTQDLAEFQATTPVKIAVENMPCRPLGPFRLEPYHFAGAGQLSRFPYLTLDTTHVGTRGADLLGFYRAIKDKVAHVHLSNYNGREHQLPHDGALPLAALLSELAGDRFGGLVSLELNPVSLQADSEERLRQNLRQSLAFCRRALAGE
ncbi:MAG: sugar phosphate isomerase/epimerase family protein [Anaerolineae bacterium]